MCSKRKKVYFVKIGKKHLHLELYHRFLSSEDKVKVQAQTLSLAVAEHLPVAMTEAPSTVTGLKERGCKDPSVFKGSNPDLCKSSKKGLFMF